MAPTWGFEAGDLVVHNRYGRGLVCKRTGVRGSTVLRVEFVNDHVLDLDENVARVMHRVATVDPLNKSEVIALANAHAAQHDDKTPAVKMRDSIVVFNDIGRKPPMEPGMDAPMRDAQGHVWFRRGAGGWRCISLPGLTMTWSELYRQRGPLKRAASTHER